MSILPERDNLLQMSDEDLLKFCHLEHFIASGRGGQKRNKTSNAVRLTLNNTDISVTASEERQQSVNKLRALRKLRLAVALEIRGEPKTWTGQLEMNSKNPLYPSFIACLTDHLHSHNWQVSEAAKEFNISTGKLIKIIAKDDSFWQFVNKQRQQQGFKILKR